MVASYKDDMKTLKRYGYEWGSPPDSELEWETTIGRSIAGTWKFGNIHQCKIFIKYKHMVDGKKYSSRHYTIGNDLVAICLRAAPTRDEAMKRMVDWIHSFDVHGPPSVEQVFQSNFDNWADLYPNRVAMIDQMFFVIGNGYSWLDGNLVSTSPDSHLEKPSASIYDTMEEEDYVPIDADDMYRAYFAEMLKPIREKQKKAKDMYWNTGTYAFYPVSQEYSNICCVPDDVKPEWLQVAYEASLLLRDHSGIPKVDDDFYGAELYSEKKGKANRKIGTKVVADLERRFPNCSLRRDTKRQGSHAKDKQVSTKKTR